MNCFIAQRYKDDGAVIRYVEIEKIYRLDTYLDEKEIMTGAGEKMIITEIVRTYLEKEKGHRQIIINLVLTPENSGMTAICAE